MNKINKGLSLEQNINEMKQIDKEIKDCEYMANNWKSSDSEADQQKDDVANNIIKMNNDLRRKIGVIIDSLKA